MESIDAVDGITHVVTEMTLLMRFMTCTIAEILCLSVPFISNFLEKRESTWEVFKGTCFLHFGKKPSKFFEGSNLLIPMVNPHID